MALVPLDAIPIIQLPDIGIAVAETYSNQTTSIEQVTKTLDNISIQSKEINTLQGKIKDLEEQKAKTKASRLVEVQKSQRLLERLQKVEKDTSIGQTLAQAK